MEELDLRKKSPDKHYIHLDKKKKFQNYEPLINNPHFVERHGFYPFVHFDITFKKYIFNKNTKKKELKKKVRPIKYAAHIDRFIYQKYAGVTNEQYDIFAKRHGIHRASIAYRKSLKGKNNIHFAKEVFEFIAKQDHAYIFLGDFTSFFDNLDHAYLKEQLMEVFDTTQLSNDHYAIFKNISKYSYINLSDIESEKELKLKQMNEQKLMKFFTTEEFHTFKRKNLKKNIAPFGIPQGSPISAVYANVYMTQFDKQMNDYATSRKGMYRRYSDDFIVVLPIGNSEEHKKHAAWITQLSDSIPRLDLQAEKTKHFLFNKEMDSRLVTVTGKSVMMNYLGFRLDGRTVTIRDKSLFKYYSRAYRKARTAARYKGKKHEKVILRKLLNLYTYIGDQRKEKDYGNFITYAKKADRLFSSSSLLSSGINNQLRKHWKKINKILKI